MKEIFFYSDALEWGGHEIISAKISNILADFFCVKFFFYNENFYSELNANVCKIKLQYHSKAPFPIFRDFINIKSAEKILKENNVKNLVVCQGNIERCLPAIFAAKKMGIKVISYLPMAYTQVEECGTFGRIRTFLSKFIYKKIDAWITISNVQKELLQRFVSKKIPIYKISNPLTLTKNFTIKQNFDVLKIVTIGRIYFKQKRQNIIPEIAKALKENNLKFEFDIVGNGSDKQKLQNILHKFNVENCVHILPWMPKDDIMKNLCEKWNCLFLPSKFEGEPIVLLEALQSGIPVIVANELYVNDFNLPNWMIFKNILDAKNKLINLKNNFNKDEVLFAQKAVLKNRSFDEFKQNVIATFKQIF